MPLFRYELFKELINHGAKFDNNVIIDPSTSNTLKEFGLGLVTSHIQELSLVDVIRDPFPIFGSEGGMWIGYKLTEYGRGLAYSDEKIREAVSQLMGPETSEIAKSVIKLIDECKQKNINENYRDDFFRTLEEISICFDQECYIATISLCGKILEVGIKEILIRNNIEFDEKMMLGRLIRLVREQMPAEYLDPSLEDLSKVISRSRNSAIHSNERIPIPSRDQTVMVIYALRDVVRRTLLYF